VGAVDLLDHLRTSQRQQIVAALEVSRMFGELGASKVGLFGLEGLDRRAHRSIEDEDALREDLL
jgi:hypothetical protein